MPQEDRVASLRSWFASARPFFKEHDPDRIPQIEALFERLRVPPPPELPICFLGSAGVGKSTLLNAIVAGDRSIVPQGGVGPLTAQATLVRYAPVRSFRATYLPARHLHNLRFALERTHEADERRRGAAVPTEDGRSTSLTEEELIEIELADPVEVDATELPPEQRLNAREKFDAYVRQARLMICGAQFVDGGTPVPYLIDALGACLGQTPRWGTTLEASHQPRVDRIRKALEFAAEGKAYELAAADNSDEIVKELQLHASDFLAPLIRQLEVAWDSPALKNGVTLVDLPGVGVANDEYRRVTAEWIRKARAVVLVVDRAGVTEAAAELLRSTGFLNSLLHEGHDPDAEPAILMIAAVKLDLVAFDSWREEEDRLGDGARPWVTHFDDVCAQMVDVIRGQVRQELDKLVEQGPEATRDERVAMTDRVLATLQIHPVCANEYRLLLRKRRADPPHIENVSESRIPQMIDALSRIGGARLARNTERTLQRLRDVEERSRNGVSLVLERWREGDRAAAEAEKVRDELAQVAAPLSRALLVRQGQFRELLRKGIPKEIELRIDLAAAEAEKDIARFLKRKYGEYHWATLRAAVRHNGTYVGSRKVSIPDELTLRFEELLTAVWTKNILAVLRKETRAIADHYADSVGEIAVWAKRQGTRVKPQLVEALHADLKSQTSEVAEVGREAIDELKEVVKTELYGAIEDEVRKQCQQFVKANRDRGTGTKARILDLLGDELAEKVVAAAKPAARKVLESRFRRVEREVSDALGRIPDPIEAAVRAIVSSHESLVRKSDAKRRDAVISTGEALLAALDKAVVST